jgi:hypothetical protein
MTWYLSTGPAYIFHIQYSLQELEGLGMGDIWINGERIIETYGNK